MKKKLNLILIAALCAAQAWAAENPWAAYRYAPDALREMDLASDKDWTLSVDGGALRPIKVTAGGWNSDQQEPQIPSADVKDSAVYERAFTIPAEAKDQVVKILFGGCNYGAEVYLDDQKITEHHAPMTPFEVDVTAVAKPGQTQRLKVKAFTRYHYGKLPQIPVGFDFNKGMSQIKWPFEGDTKFAYGLTGYVRLALYPAVHLTEVFVRPSVRGKSLAYDVWIANGSATEREVVLKGALSSWDKRTWPYPALPDRTARLAPGQVQKVTIEGVPWTFGSESYWWPNIPFREDYQATLHWLNLTLEEAGKPLHQLRQRFGFVEYQEGPFYYTVNGVRFSGFGDCNSYGQVGEYDCWTETPCFQPPHGEFKGCAETWRRYQRIGFNSMRLSTSVPTRYMLETADEAGFMLIPEGGNWGGNGGMGPNSFTNFMVQVQETIRAVRNHPSIPRYSLANESVHGWPLDDPRNPWRPLVDAALEVDPTRPLVFECDYGQSGVVPGMKRGQACVAEHYMPVFLSHDRIRSMGETTWATDGMAAFTSQALAMRLNDWAYFASWSWLNYWPNFLEGMNAARHPWKHNDYGDRKDGVDGWGSPSIQAVQWALHPYLVIDRGLLEFNPAIKENSKAGKIAWPYRTPVYAAGAKIERPIEVFNGALSGDQFKLNWSAHWDSPSGPSAAQGAVGPFQIEPGFHATQTVTFEAPKPEAKERSLYLVLESVKDGKVVFHDEHSRLAVTANPIPPAEAVFAGVDETTQGDWQGKYGKNGFWLAGGGVKLPPGVGIDMPPLEPRVWEKDSKERRALVGDDGKRIAAGWYFKVPALLFLKVGDAPRKVTFYFLNIKDGNRVDPAKNREEVISIRTLDGRLLDQRSVSDFQEGKYLSWKIWGEVSVEIERGKESGGAAPTFSALFVDEAEKAPPLAKQVEADGDDHRADGRRAEKAPPLAKQVEGLGCRVLVGGWELPYVAVFDEVGHEEWRIPTNGRLCDCWLLGTDKVLFSNAYGIQAVRRDSTNPNGYTELWNYKKGGEADGCQPLPNGDILTCINYPSSIVITEIEPDTMKEKFRLTISDPGFRVHANVHQVRKTKQGTYLVAKQSKPMEGREYDASGKCIRTFPGVGFALQQLPDGSYVGSGGDGHCIIGFDAQGKETWKIGAQDIPGFQIGFAAGVQLLEDGTLLVANWAGHGGGKGPCIGRISADRKSLIGSLQTQPMNSINCFQVITKQENKVNLNDALAPVSK